MGAGPRRILLRLGRPPDAGEGPPFNDARQAYLPWVDVNREYGEFHGVRVPGGGFAFWKYDAGDFDYIRWRITQLDFDQPERF